MVAKAYGVFAMPPKSAQLTLPFDKLTENNLKPIVKKFEKLGRPVASVDAPNTAKRESGVLVKNFTLTFEDGQQLLVRVKAGGTIYQVKLNNKVVPVKHVDDMDKAIGEMYDYLYYNAKAFERAKMQREKRKINPPAPPITTTRKEKIAKAREDFESISQNNQTLESDLSAKQTDLNEYRQKLKELEQALEQERGITVSLESQIAELQKAQGA